MSDATRERLEKIFSQILAPPAGMSVDEVSMETVPRWDSVAHINLILAVEQEFRIALTPEEASYAVSFSEMLALVDGKV